MISSYVLCLVTHLHCCICYRSQPQIREPANAYRIDKMNVSTNSISHSSIGPATITKDGPSLPWKVAVAVRYVTPSEDVPSLILRVVSCPRIVTGFSSMRVDSVLYQMLFGSPGRSLICLNISSTLMLVSWGN